jgi:hypothetical protein
MNHKHEKFHCHHPWSTNLPSLSLSLTMAKGKRGYKVTTTIVTVAAALIVDTSAVLLPPLPAIAAALQRLPLPWLLSLLITNPPAAFC